MSSLAKLFGGVVILAGAGVLLTSLSMWETRHLLLYLGCLTLALACSRLKVTQPSLPNGMPVFFIYVLFGLVEFSLSETLLLGCAATLLQNFHRDKTWGSERAGLLYVVFNICNIALAIWMAYSTYHSFIQREQRLEPMLVLILATVVFFGISTFSVAAMISIFKRESLLEVWRTGYFRSFPHYLAGAVLAGVAAILTPTIGWQTSLAIVPIAYLAYRSYSTYLAHVEDCRTHAEDIASLHLRTIEALALAIQAKDRTTHDHLRRVQVYAIEVAKELQLSESDLEALRAAALLHDIGKLAVPEHIISKPGKLTPEEFEKMKIHPVVGAEILERVRFPYPVTPIVRSHHEKWNGTGYPDGLKGEQIPIGARILAAVDCLDALASDRQYRRAIKLEDAMRKVASEAGISFDPRVVAILQRRWAELEKLAVQSCEESATLSTHVKVEPGLEPATGFEASQNRPDFLSSIAAASQEAQTLFELAQDLGNSLSLNETLSLAAMRVKRMIPYDSLAIYVPHGSVLRAEYVIGENLRLFSTLEIAFGKGVSGWVAENRKPVINGNPAIEPGYTGNEGSFTSLRSALSVPLFGANSLAGVLTLYQAERDAFTQDHLRIMLAVAPKIGLAVENALKFQQAESSAATDYMTGLPNARSLFLHLDNELARCRRTGTPLILLVCDLNGFKQVNDQFGHLEGNRLLKVAAGKLKESCREYDYVARMGGDEFVLIFPGLTLDQLQSKSARLNTITREAGKEVCGVDTLGLSIGHASYPDDGTDAEQLLSEADRRMYAVKQKEKMRLVEPRGYDFDELLAR